MANASKLVLNLDPDFKPFDKVCQEIEHTSFFFNGGEPHIRIKDFYHHSSVIVTTRINNMDSFGLLLVAVDALKRLNGIDSIELFIPYFPGARQDRVANMGEALTVKVYADIINSMNLDGVYIMDPHSDVTPALINNCWVTDNHKFVLEVLRRLYPKKDAPTPILISPDAGAHKKVIDVAKFLTTYNMVEIVKCSKIRNTGTGELSGFQVHADDLGQKDCIIVDDICDGGGTFIGLAEKLKAKGSGNIYLAVTHGIFSKGFSSFHNFERIFTTDSIRSKHDPDLVEIININR